MAFDRYAQSDILGLGKQYGTSQAHITIRNAIKTNAIGFQTILLQGNERLDSLAGQYYGDGTLWWILAAASDIGWGLQVPPGTIINVPDIKEVAQLLG